MDPINTLITGKLIDITWDAFGGPVKDYIFRLFKGKGGHPENRSDGLEHSDGIAVGLAIGYFHNFLQPLETTVANNGLLVFSTRFEKVAGPEVFSPAIVAEIGEEVAAQMSMRIIEKHALLDSYDARDVRLSIVYPGTLDRPNFIRMNDYLSNETQKGTYYNRPNSRPYGINYNVVDDTKIRIVDYARPIEAIWKYYREDKKLAQDDIAAIQVEEIRLFLAVVRRLMEDNSRHLFRHTEFIPIK